jgi:hypothetical protein
MNQADKLEVAHKAWEAMRTEMPGKYVSWLDVADEFKLSLIDIVRDIEQKGAPSSLFEEKVAELLKPKAEDKKK